MLAFDGVYIPVLFLTGSAGKSAEGAGQGHGSDVGVLVSNGQRCVGPWRPQCRASATV